MHVSHENRNLRIQRETSPCSPHRMDSGGLSLALGFFLLACAPRTEPQLQTPAPDLIESICAIESRRHLPSAADQIAYFNNASMDAYAQHPGNPERLVHEIGQRDILCRSALTQLLGRVHGDYVTGHWNLLNDALDALGKRHLVLGLMDARVPAAESLVFPLLAPEQPKTVRLEATKLLQRIPQAHHLQAISEALSAEKDPELLELMVLSLNLDRAPSLLDILSAQRSRPEEDFHKTMMITVAASGHPGKREFFASYLSHENPKLRTMAQSMLASLEEKERLTLTFSLPPGVTPVSSEALFHALASADWDEAIYLLSQKVDPHAMDERGRTPLMALIDAYRLKMVMENGPLDARFVEDEAWLADTRRFLKAYLDAGGNIDVTSRSGQTPLYYAAMKNRSRLAALLLEHGADPHGRDTNGMTPRDIAEMLEFSSILHVLNAHERDAKKPVHAP